MYVLNVHEEDGTDRTTANIYCWTYAQAKEQLSHIWTGAKTYFYIPDENDEWQWEPHVVYHTCKASIEYIEYVPEYEKDGIRDHDQNYGQMDYYITDLSLVDCNLEPPYEG